MLFRTALPFALLAALATAGHAAPTVPLDHFVHLDEYAQPRLSPDGRFLAVTVRMASGARTVPVVTIYTLPDLKIAGGVRLPIFQVPLGYTWVSKTRLAITKALEMGAYDAPQATGEVLAAEYDGSKQEYLYGYRVGEFSRRADFYGDDYGYGSITALPPVRNGHFFLTAHEPKSKHSILYDINGAGGARKVLADLDKENMDFLVQNDGSPRFAFGTGEDTRMHLYRRNDATGAWDKQAGDLGKRFIPTDISADDREFVAFHSADGGPDQLVRQALAGGASTTLFADPRASVERLMYGAKPGLPFAASVDVGIPKPTYFDPASDDARLHRLISEQFAGDYVQFINFTEDGKTLLFMVQSDRDPGSYFLFNRATMKADFLFSVLSKIDPKSMAERRPIAFKARDGLDLYGYLTMPKHAAGTRLPMVVLPHGGPHGVFDSWFFDRDAQFLASRGYAVLQVNYRGSGGRGVNFEHAGYRQWGAKIQDDLVDGIKWAAGQGEIDGARVCSYGVSFGAYSALMLAAREPGLIKCAIGYAGVYNLNLLFKEDRAQTSKTTFNFYDKFVGQDKAELDRFSPVTLAGAIKAPVLLVHGGKDETAPPKHADEMRAALVKENRPPEWLYMPAEGHGFYDTANITRFYQTLEAFLDKHIGH